MSSGFQGFSPQALAFFEELSANNNKAWFEAHRADYETLLLEPLKELVAELAAPLLAIDPALQLLPPSRCIARIHRDIRFSRDKSPYKTHLWLSFKRPSPDWKEHPCFFFEIAADRYRYGMGFYSAAEGDHGRPAPHHRDGAGEVPPPRRTHQADRGASSPKENSTSAPSTPPSPPTSSPGTAARTSIWSATVSRTNGFFRRGLWRSCGKGMGSWRRFIGCCGGWGSCLK